MPNQPKNQAIIEPHTVKKIRCGVVSAHLLVLMLVLTFSVVSDWINTPEETITIQFYDPKLDNIVDNPSPAPDPANPIPPSGNQDGGEPENVTEPAPQPEPKPTPQPRILTPEPVKSIEQPTVKPRKLPRPAVNKKLPPAKEVPQTKAIKQPKISKRKLPENAAAKKSASRNAEKTGSKGPRGSNPQQGHTAPGGQSGNSGYDIQVAMMIKRMWETPDTNRLGGRTPRVLIEVNIASDGRVTSKRIRAASGIPAMDESVRNLLDRLRYVKRPFDNKPHKLIFYLKAE